MIKEIIWLGSSLDDLKGIPADAKRKAGYELYNVQVGLEPSDWKPMPSIGVGLEEIRISAGNKYRVIYVAKFKLAVYVLHCFVKKTRKTPLRDIDLAKDRYRKLMTLVRGRK